VISGSDSPGWLKELAILALLVAFVCAAVIAFDILTGRKQKMAIMNVVWPVTALYFGPLALWAYLRFGRPGFGSGENQKPFWQSVAVGDSHCGAGCTLGDFAGEWMVFLLGFTIAGSTLLANYAVDFAAAYLLGIVFQYFAIAPMRNLSGWPGIKAAVKADTVSLIAFECGMFAWMAFASKILFDPKPEPTSPLYWFSMQIAMVIGFATAFPANWWLIRKGLKEKM